MVELAQLMLDYDYEIPQEKLTQIYDYQPLYESVSLQELLKNETGTKSPEKPLLMKIRLQDTYDIDFIKRDTGGR